MSVDHKIIRSSENFRGLDKRSSDITRSMEFATDIRNAAFRVSGAINKRKGFQHIDLDTTADTWCAGMTTYTNVDSTGGLNDELIRVLYTAPASGSDTIKVQKLRTSWTMPEGLKINLPSAITSVYDVYYSLKVDETTKTHIFSLKLFNKTTFEEEVIFTQDVGTGKEDPSDADFYSVSDLAYAITSALVTTYSITATAIIIGGDSAALLGGLTRQLGFTITYASEGQLKAGSDTLTKYQWEDLDVGDTANIADLYESGPVRTFTTDRDNLENVSFAQLNNVLYISNGYNYVLKYDGNKVYRAGLPGLVNDVIPGTWAYDIQSVIEVEKGAGGSSIPHGDYWYKLVIEYTDNKGNFITSQPSDPILMNLTTNSGHIDLYWNTSIFSNLDLDTSRLRVAVYRTIRLGNYGTTTAVDAAGALYYRLGDVPYNNNEGHTMTTSGNPVRFEDTNIITGNQAAYKLLNEPIKRHDPPPKGRYLTVFKNCLVISGQKENVNNLQYSLPKNADTQEIGSEYFPDDDNGIIIQSIFGDKITAIAPLRDLLYVFHKNSISVLSGNINELEAPTVDLITKEGNVGCQSFHSIEELNNTLIFLSQNGIYTIDSSNALTELSSLIKPIFLDKNLVRKRTVTFNWTEKNILLFIIPKETDYTYPQVLYEPLDTLSSSIVLAYDYFKEAWLQWDSVDFSGGISLFEDELYFTGREKDKIFTSFFLDNGDTYDYRNHNEPIKFNYETNWESLQDPTIPKKYLRLKIHSFDSDTTFESPQGFDINVYIQKNYVNTDLGVINFDFGKNSGGGWGSFSWGSGTWGSIATDSSKSKLPTGKSKCMKLRFVNEDLHENVLITTYELEIAAPYLTEIKE